MIKIVATALAVVALVTGALALTAFRGHRDAARTERFFRNHVEDMLDAVHATDAQRQQIHAIEDRLVADGRSLHAGQAEARKQLLDAWRSDQPVPGSVHSVIDARADAMKRFADEVADAVLQVHAILTPEQRAIVTRRLERHAHAAGASQPQHP